MKLNSLEQGRKLIKLMTLTLSILDMGLGSLRFSKANLMILKSLSQERTNLKHLLVKIHSWKYLLT